MTFSRSAIPVLLGFATVAAAQKPAIGTNGIVNGASYALVGLPNSSIAQGSIFVIFGDNMGPAQKVQVSSWPLPTTQGLAGTSVNIAAGGQNYAAIMLYTIKTQVAAILPSAVPVGPAQVTVTYNGQQSAPQQITVTDRSFGTFALNQAGSGPGVMQNFIDDATRPFNTLAEAAQTGQVITLWGTGLGKVSFDETQPPVSSDMKQGVEVWVGGQPAVVQYAGRAPCCAGIDQINFVVPSGLNACYVPVAVKIGNVAGNYVSMSVAPKRGACSDQLTLPGLDFSQVQANGVVREGTITLQRDSSSAMGVAVNTDRASAQFAKLDFNSVVQSHGLSDGVSQIGACMVFSFQGTNPNFQDVAPSGELNAGPQLTLTTPSGTKTLTSTDQTKHQYRFPVSGGAPTPFLDPGAYTISGPGGADVGSFSATITIPQLFKPNLDTISTVSRSAGLTLNWSGGKPDDMVFVLGAAGVTTPQVGAAFVCLGRISDGSLTVPPAVLLALPAASGANGAISAGELSAPVTFKASGLDMGQLMYVLSTVKSPVTYQ